MLKQLGAKLNPLPNRDEIERDDAMRMNIKSHLNSKDSFNLVYK